MTLSDEIKKEIKDQIVEQLAPDKFATLAKAYLTWLCESYGNIMGAGATREPVMGQWNVVANAVVISDAGEWVTLVEATIYANGSAVSGPVPLTPTFFANLWTCTIYGADPMPDTVKLEATFIKVANGEYVETKKKVYQEITQASNLKSAGAKSDPEATASRHEGLISVTVTGITLDDLANRTRIPTAQLVDRVGTPIGDRIQLTHRIDGTFCGAGEEEEPVMGCIVTILLENEDVETKIGIGESPCPCSLEPEQQN